MAGALELKLLTQIAQAVCCAANPAAQVPSATVSNLAVSDALGASIAVGACTSLELENFDDAYWLFVNNGSQAFFVRPGGSKVFAFGTVFDWGTLEIFAVVGPQDATAVIPSDNVFVQVTKLSQA